MKKLATIDQIHRAVGKPTTDEYRKSSLEEQRFAQSVWLLAFPSHMTSKQRKSFLKVLEKQEMFCFLNKKP